MIVFKTLLKDCLLLNQKYFVTKEITFSRVNIRLFLKKKKNYAAFKEACL